TRGGQHLAGDLTLDGQDEPLALADIGEQVESQPRQGTGDGLALGVENLGLEHDVDDDYSHARCSSKSWGLGQVSGLMSPSLGEGSTGQRLVGLDVLRPGGVDDVLGK